MPPVAAWTRAKARCGAAIARSSRKPALADREVRAGSGAFRRSPTCRNTTAGREKIAHTLTWRRPIRRLGPADGAEPHGAWLDRRRGSCAARPTPENAQRRAADPGGPVGLGSAPVNLRRGYGPPPGAHKAGSGPTGPHQREPVDHHVQISAMKLCPNGRRSGRGRSSARSRARRPSRSCRKEASSRPSFGDSVNALADWRPRAAQAPSAARNSRKTKAQDDRGDQSAKKRTGEGHRAERETGEEGDGNEDDDQHQGGGASQTDLPI